MTWLRNNVYLVGYLVFVTLMILTLGYINDRQESSRDTRTDEIIEVLYQNNLEGCERGNLLRRVLYQNTKEAARIEPEATYADQLKLLSQYPTADPVTGEIDCEKVTPCPQEVD